MSTESDVVTIMLDEYRILSSHYFYEDEQLTKTATLYATLNAALLAFSGSAFVQSNAIPPGFIPLVGLIASVAWFAELVRIREWRIYIESKIAELETALSPLLKSAGAPALELRALKKWEKAAPPEKRLNAPYRWFRNLPSSLTSLVLPVAFAGCWTTLLLRSVL